MLDMTTSQQRWLTSLEERTLPHFNQLVVWTRRPLAGWQDKLNAQGDAR